MLYQSVGIDKRTFQGVEISLVLNRSDRWITTSNDRLKKGIKYQSPASLCSVNESIIRYCRRHIFPKETEMESEDQKVNLNGIRYQCHALRNFKPT